MNETQAINEAIKCMLEMITYWKSYLTLTDTPMTMQELKTYYRQRTKSALDAIDTLKTIPTYQKTFDYFRTPEAQQND